MVGAVFQGQDSSGSRAHEAGTKRGMVLLWLFVPQGRCPAPQTTNPQTPAPLQAGSQALSES